jgi:hypothetical protein
MHSSVRGRSNIRATRVHFHNDDQLNIEHEYVESLSRT